MTRINISITDDATLELLQELAQKTGVPSYANLVRLAIKHYSDSWLITEKQKNAYDSKGKLKKVVKVREE